MGHNLSIQEAAEQLQEALSWYPGLVSVGIGRHEGHATLYVYMARKYQVPEHPTFMGYPVIYEVTGRVRPA